MEQVKAMLAALRENYLRDLPSHIDEIEQLLLELEREGFQLSLCRELYRQVHSLKGSGGTYGMNFISDICHPMEDLLSHLIEHPQQLQQGVIGTALEYVDLIRKACFSYSVNLEPSQELKLSLHALRQRASKSRYSALIVESSEVVVGILREVLLDEGFRVEVVHDGYLALGRALSEPFDLLVSGLEVPRLNGLALISAIQKSGIRSGKTKTLLLTTSDHLDHQVHPDFLLRKNAELKRNFRACVADLLAKAVH
ncbi:Hpt domain-containing protein [Undibacterium fentianense]|uniref:Hpt domain-containing protein n=1 Tax=Undibacterium fentianense TaxID=2828728 RepID=A0A941E480_9BURK|nr:Hpt domain-containing protein [Undibacterium fentianense]MBR7800726.1 Hpt domain-containing protein [Undibacterium fentianense]